MNHLIEQLRSWPTNLASALQRVYGYDGRSGQFYSRKPRMQIWNRDPIYLVSIGQYSEVNQTVSEFELDGIRNVEIIIRYQLQIPATAVEEFLQSFLGQTADPNRAIEDFEEFLKSTLRQIGRRRTITNFDQERDNIATQLVEKVAETYGADFRCELEMGAKPLEAPVSAEATRIEVMLQGYGRSLDLLASFSVAVDPSHQMAAAGRPLSDRELVDLIRTSIRTHIDAVATLDSVLTGMQIVERDLSEQVNRDLRIYGRKLRHLSLQVADPPPVPPPHLIVEDKVPVRVRDTDKEVDIKHHLILERENIAAFLSARACGAAENDVENWFKGLLRTETAKSVQVKDPQGATQRLTYSDLILNFDRKRMEGAVAAAAKSIGYGVSLYIGVPDVRAIELSERPTSLREIRGEYQTSEMTVHVGLAVDLRLQLADLHAISQRIRPDIDLEDEIRDAVVEACKQKIVELGPRDFYLFFNRSPNQAPEELLSDAHWHNGGELSVREYLERAIRGRLEGEFSATILNLSARPTDSLIVKRIAALLGLGPMQLDLGDVESLYEGGQTDMVTYKVFFRVTGVDPDHWSSFQHGRFEENGQYSVAKEKETIRTQLQATLERRLKTIPAEFREFNDETVRLEVKKLLQDATASVTESLGLKISVDEVDRRSVDTEIVARTTRKEALKQQETAFNHSIRQSNRLLESDQAALDRLIERREEAVTDEDYKTVAEIDEQIQKHGASRPSRMALPHTEAVSLAPRRGRDFHDGTRNLASPAADHNQDTAPETQVLDDQPEPSDAPRSTD